MSAAPKDQYFLWQLSSEHEAQIRYQESGGGASDAKPPVLFLHGYGAMIEHWKDNIPRFAETRKVYAMDLIGFGKSQKPNVRYSLELFAAQIEAFLHLKRLEEIILIGHSMGGASSLYYAHLQPRKVRALILANPSGLYSDSMDGMAKVFFGLIGSPLIGEVLFTAFANPAGVSQSLVPTYHNQNRVDLSLINQFTRPLRDKGAVWSYLSPSRRPEDFTLDHLEKPCRYTGKAFLVWGAEDSALPPQKIIPEFQQLLPKAGAFIIPKSGHCTHHDTPEAFNRQLQSILDSLD